MPPIDLTRFQISPWLIILAIISIIVFLVITIIWGILAHRRQISAGREDMVGRIAEVKVALTPKGTVFVEGEQWTAISETGRVEPGEEVTVNRVDSLKLYVSNITKGGK